jgi:hypothetical protein
MNIFINTYFKYSVAYNRTSGLTFNNVYDSIYPIFTLDKTTQAPLPASDVSKYGSQYAKKYSFPNVYDKFREESMQKLDNLKKRILSFHKSQLLKELKNECSESKGGLDSWDDTFIPWVWALNGSNSTFNMSCVDSGGDCKCTGMVSDKNAVIVTGTAATNRSSYWSTLTNDMVVESPDDSFKTVLGNLSLPINFYLTDSVGNYIRFIYFSDGNNGVGVLNSSGTPVPPKMPSINYTTGTVANPAYNYKIQGELNILQAGTSNAYNNTSLFFIYD